MLSIGDKAPDFDLMTDEGKQVRLKDLKGRRTILYFYPKDDTPGCTKEACGFRDQFRKFDKGGIAIFGVSLDAKAAHQKFRAKYNLPFPLLCDEDARMSKAFGVYKKKSLYGRTYWGIERTTFIVGPEGKIESIFPRVKVDNHVKEVAAAAGL